MAIVSAMDVVQVCQLRQVWEEEQADNETYERVHVISGGGFPNRDAGHRFYLSARLICDLAVGR